MVNVFIIFQCSYLSKRFTVEIIKKKKKFFFFFFIEYHVGNYSNSNSSTKYFHYYQYYLQKIKISKNYTYLKKKFFILNNKFFSHTFDNLLL